MACAWFDIDGVTLAVQGDHGAIPLFKFLLKSRQLSAPLEYGKTVKITISTSPSRANCQGEPISQSQLPNAQILSVFQLDDQALVARVGDRLTIELLADGAAIISGVDDDDRNPAGLEDLLLLALDHAVTAADQSFVHAACLATPDGKSAVLMHAESGTGKTTTSFAMTLEGYRIISDDAAVLRCMGNASTPTMWGVPRAPKVDGNTVAALPFLASYFDHAASDSAGEQFLDRQALIDADIFRDAGALPISAVVSLARDATLPPSIIKVGPFDGLSDMLGDNMSTIGASLLPTHEKRLTTYSNLVRQCPCLRVNMNGTPVDIARMIATGISRYS